MKTRREKWKWKWNLLNRLVYGISSHLRKGKGKEGKRTNTLLCSTQALLPAHSACTFVCVRIHIHACVSASTTMHAYTIPYHEESLMADVSKNPPFSSSPYTLCFVDFWQFRIHLKFALFGYAGLVIRDLGSGLA